MKIVNRVEELKQQIQQAKKENKSIGFVPTMGFLHAGHLSLIERARKENDLVVVSIFVNPLQFGPNEDYETYPRDLERDGELAKRLGVDYLFMPPVVEMYGETQTVTVKVLERTDVLCGKSRPGHFDGVATVLTKLFMIVEPHRAYFGMKDAQQVAVVEGLIHDFNFPIELVGVETKREEDGLALSSRNVNLTQEERMEAPSIYQSLKLVEEKIGNGERIDDALAAGLDYLHANMTGEIDYYEVLSYPALKQYTEQDSKIIIAAAVQYSSVRLIDNLVVTLQPEGEI